MATKKDLVEAYSFSRRRLVTAFVSGAPGGREVEPARPGRAVIGGIAIAVLLLAGAAVLKIIGSPVDLDPDQAQLISEKESGADYVLISTQGEEGLQLRPVINITSAMLLLGADIEPLVVPRNKLTDLEPGEQIGILQAPATPPPVSGLIGSGWTACTGEVGGSPVGLKVRVSRDPQVVPTPDVSLVVRAVSDDPDEDGTVYLVSESARGADDGQPRAYSYEIPGDPGGVLGNVTSSGESQAVEVPAQWLTTFPSGGPLALSTFGLTPNQLGEPFPGRPGDGPFSDAVVGDVVEIGDAGDQRYLLSADGSAVRLDDFAARVYAGVLPKKFDREPIDGGNALPAGLERDLPSLSNASWPPAPTTEPPSGEYCSVLRAGPGLTPSVVLARAVPGGPASAVGIEADDRLPTVDAGAGAFVRSGGWSDAQAPTRVLLDDRAIAYGVAGQTEQDNLGYAAVEAEVVPDSWLELFDPGVLLSIEAAQCPPTSVALDEPCA
ncbi:type VII secretion protein EccB [Nocardioides sp.]|uniref:type VII secretion protein EccB n=1 Tax=Nocardioides sp. TaxID=35761 RepID=UPI0032196AF6